MGYTIKAFREIEEDQICLLVLVYRICKLMAKGYQLCFTTSLSSELEAILIICQDLVVLQVSRDVVGEKVFLEFAAQVCQRDWCVIR